MLWYVWYNAEEILLFFFSEKLCYTSELQFFLGNPQAHEGKTCWSNLKGFWKAVLSMLTTEDLRASKF